MVFSNALLLALGAVLLALPVVLHFAMQARPKPLPFPAFQFLLESQAVQSRRLRIKHWLLLAARILLVALPALALAGPSVAENRLAAWYSSGLAGGLTLLLGAVFLFAWLRQSGRLLLAVCGLMWLGSAVWMLVQLYSAMRPEGRQMLGRAEEPVTAVLIVDTSPRMSCRRENRTNLEFAQERGDWILRMLPRDSQISVIDTADPEPFFSVDPGSAGRRLKSLQIAFVQPGLPSALQAAARLLERAEYERREIYVLTDLSAAAWNNAVELPRLIQESGAELFVFDVGSLQPGNLRLNNLRPESVQLSGDSSLAIETSLNSDGPGGERVVELRIEQADPSRPVLRDGRVLTPERFWSVQQSVEVPDGGSAGISLRFEQSLPPGIHHGTIQLLGSDALPLDDQRFFTVSVDQRWRVCVLHGNGVNPANLTDMLAVPGFTSYEVTAAVQSELNTLDLGQFNAVFLLDPDPLAENDWDRLLKYVQQGGGLGIFPGVGALLNGQAEPGFACPAARQLLGGILTVPMRQPDGNLFLAPEGLSHAVFNDVRPVQSAVAWNRFSVRIYWGMRLDPADAIPGQVILRFSNGDPALLERNVGLGRCLVMTTPITEPARPSGRSGWNSLFLGSPVPAWLLMRGVTQYLVQSRSETLNLLTGQPAVLKNDVRVHPDAYTLFTPDPSRPPSAIQATRGEVRFAFTQYPGQYRMKGIRDGAPVTRGFSVNIEDSGTDLTRLEPGQLDGILGAGNYKLAREEGEFERQQGTSRRGQEFYPLLLVVLTVVLAAESLLGNRFYGSQRKPAGNLRKTAAGTG